MTQRCARRVAPLNRSSARAGYLRGGVRESHRIVPRVPEGVVRAMPTCAADCRAGSGGASSEPRPLKLRIAGSIEASPQISWGGHDRRVFPIRPWCFAAVEWACQAVAIPVGAQSAQMELRHARTRLGGDEFFQFQEDLVNDALPVLVLGLSIEFCGRIPWRISPLEHPSEIRMIWQQYPDRFANGPGNMGDTGIHANYQV